MPLHHNIIPQQAPGERVMVGLSGGVDSAVSAWRLQQQGYDVQALFMKNWEEDDNADHCNAAIDLEDAASVCDTLQIPLHTRNFSSEYWEHVFEYFLAEYRAGRTPNPDVLCNREIKFKTFLEHAQILGADRIATGHYAQITRRDGYIHLHKAADLNKDQTYFLHALSQQQLTKAWFPLGGLTKPEVRRIAQQVGFKNAAKKDSTGICFIGKRKFKQFLSRYLPAQPGEMRTPEGRLMGEHDGLMYYTLGQRQGLRLGGNKDDSGEPWYVVDKELDSNTLIIVQGHDHPLLYRHQLSARQLNWIAETPVILSAHPLRCHAKTRYRQPDQACAIERLEGDTCEVVFNQPQRAVTPGQSVVFYQGDECLGGGVIQ
jgi:tRNA-specific 2-thiouridylase